MAMISMMVGGVTDTTARFAAKVGTGPVRIAYSTDPGMATPSYSASTAVDAQGVALVSVTGLTADTRYYWQVEDNSVLDTSATGQFITDPTAAGTAASFTIGVCGDAGHDPVYPGVTGAVPTRLSNHPVFDTVRGRAVAEDWRRVVHLGDMCYYDLGSGLWGLSALATAAQYRSMWDDVLAQPRQHQLYREVPLVYVWDDHDYGPNNSDSTSPGRDNACTVYRERFPAYTLPAGAGANPIYHEFTIGRILFVVSDTRADRVTGSTMLGAAQLAWLDTLLSTSTAAALVWLMPTPWLGGTSDNWFGYPAEQATILGMLGDYGWLDRMVMVSADKHVLAIDSGAGGGATKGGFPNMLCASLDATPSENSTQYDLGQWPGRNQYGTIDVDDDGTEIVITMTAYRGTTPMGWTYINTAGTTSIPAGPPSHVIAL
jgi:phosphodiesterase/alkaline phosphatase D-like protein